MGMNVFEIIFHPDAENEIYELESSMQGKVFVALDKLEARGNQLRAPHTETIRDGLFELRAGKKDITRTFFAFAKGKKIYILRTFIKKTRKTPESEITLAFKRLEELLNDE
nr:Toxin HigB [Morganella morganii]